MRLNISEKISLSENPEIRNLCLGISNLILLIFVTLACIGIITSYFIASQGAITIEKVKREERKKEGLDDKIKGINKILLDISPLIKKVSEYEYVKIDGETGIRPYLEKKLKDYKLVSKIDPLGEVGGEDVNLEDIINEAAKQLNKSEIALSRAQYGKELSEERSIKFRDAVTVVEKLKDNEIAEIKMRERELSSVEIKERANYKSRADELNREKKRITVELPRADEKFKKRKFDLQNQISFTTRAIERLTALEVTRREIVKAHGHIFNAGPENQYAFINLGADDSITLGLKFRIFRKDKYGTKRWKGQVEVKRIFKTYSQVSINRVENKLDPVTDGDLLANIFYCRGKQPRVVLVGLFERGDFKYHRAETQRRLTKIGVIIEEKVSLRTDFVIIGKEPERYDIDRQNYSLAKRLNIPLVEEKKARESIKYYLGD